MRIKGRTNKDHHPQPNPPAFNKTKQEIRRHLRWLALLGQDCFLLGPPSPFRRWRWSC